ncbi:MAG: hypothetical protein LBS50_01930 [Prevotellaceae bacterium]|jgi:hypothetical protein|nr:hypothetical protein [Prevotellaceae bacterium]
MDTKKIALCIIVCVFNSCIFFSIFPPEPDVHYDKIFFENATSQDIIIHIPIYSDGTGEESSHWQNGYWIETIQPGTAYKYYDIPEFMQGEDCFKRYIVGNTVKVFSLSGELLKEWYGPFREDDAENHDFFNTNSWLEEIKNLKSGKKNTTHYYYYFTIFNSDFQ